MSDEKPKFQDLVSGHMAAITVAYVTLVNALADAKVIDAKAFAASLDDAGRAIEAESQPSAKELLNLMAKIIRGEAQ